MAFDGIAVCALTEELNQQLAEGRVEKINQPERDELSLLIRAGGKNHRLILSASPSTPRIHLTTQSKENPEKAPMFCMLLRKHIQGGRILGFTQPELERVFIISIESRNELGDLSVKKLIAEIMGKHSNLILTDEEDKILGSIKHIDFTVSSVRQVIPGMRYELPPAQHKQNPKTVTAEEMIPILRSSCGPADQCMLSTLEGISPLTAREIAFLGLGETDTDLSRVSDVTITRFSHFIQKYFERIFSTPYTPILLYKPNGRIADFSAIDITQYGEAMRKEAAGSISEAVERLYSTKDLQERFSQKISGLLKFVENNIARCEKKLQLQLKQLQDCEKKEKHRMYGDLLMANLYRISGGKSVVLENFYQENEEVTIPLKEELTPSQNAQRYYKLFQKAKNTEHMTQIQLKKTKEELAYLESVLNNILSSDTLGDIAEIREELAGEGYLMRGTAKQKKQKKKTAVSLPISYEVEGYEILIGKNNLQNDMLTLKTASNSDLWLHTKDFPSAHVVIRTKGQQPPDEVILRAARLCAAHSKAKNSQNVPVDYTEIRNVKKPKGAKAGMVIYDHYNTVYVTPEA